MKKSLERTFFSAFIDFPSFVCFAGVPTDTLDRAVTTKISMGLIWVSYWRCQFVLTYSDDFLFLTQPDDRASCWKQPASPVVLSQPCSSSSSLAPSSMSDGIKARNASLSKTRPCNVHKTVTPMAITIKPQTSSMVHQARVAVNSHKYTLVVN